MKLYCISASVITALLMAISVFVANVSHTEYKSQMKKRKAKKTEQSSLEQTDQTRLEQVVPEQENNIAPVQ